MGVLLFVSFVSLKKKSEKWRSLDEEFKVLHSEVLF